MNLTEHANNLERWRDKIREFDRKCERAQHTDISEVWDLLESLEDEISATLKNWVGQ